MLELTDFSIIYNRKEWEKNNAYERKLIKLSYMHIFEYYTAIKNNDIVIDLQKSKMFMICYFFKCKEICMIHDTYKPIFQFQRNTH